MSASLVLVMMLQAAPDAADILAQARQAEAIAAPACLQALRTGPVGGEACETYKQAVRALRAAGGEAAVRDSSWATVSTTWRHRSYNEHIRNYSAAASAFGNSRF